MNIYIYVLVRVLYGTHTNKSTEFVYKHIKLMILIINRDIYLKYIAYCISHCLLIVNLTYISNMSNQVFLSVYDVLRVFH